jgi:signal transduction histidine kinase
MNKLSIITKVIFINIIVMAFFLIIFIWQNYITVAKQLDKVGDEKISSIIRTLEPIVSINLSLGLKNNYINAIENIILNYKEIVTITLFDENEQVIYKNDRIIKNSLDTKQASIKLKDSLLQTPLGTLKIYYTFADISNKLLEDFKIFLFYMFLFFLLSLFISIVLIKKNLYPLEILKNKMLTYSFNDKVIFEKMSGQNEIVVINNSVKQMIERIEKEVDTRILYEKDIMQKNRLASMGEMIDNIAHQWRQPLMKINSILLNIDRMSELNKLEKTYLSHKIIEASETVYHMSETIDVFREFVNPNKVKEKFELNETFDQAIKFMNSSFNDITVIFKSDNKFYLNGIENELTQVILSLFTNSKEIFEIRKIKNKEIFINIFKDEDNIIITIEDNAGGIKDEFIKKIFDPYFTTKYSSGGTGMGLYICKLIVTNSFKGTIDAENIENGVMFKIIIKGLTNE